MQLSDFLVDAVLRQVRHCQVVLGLDQVRPQEDRALKFVNSFVVVARGERGSQVSVRFRVGWIQADRFAKFFDGFLISAGLNESKAEVIVGFGEDGTQLNGLPKLLYHRLRVASCLTQKNSQGVVGERIVCFVSNRFLNGINRKFQVGNFFGRVSVDNRLKLLE